MSLPVSFVRPEVDWMASLWYDCSGQKQPHDRKGEVPLRDYRSGLYTYACGELSVTAPGHAT